MLFYIYSITHSNFEEFYKRKRGDSNIYLRKLKAQGYIILEPVSVNHKNTYDFSCLPLKNIRMYNLCVLSNKNIINIKEAYTNEEMFDYNYFISYFSIFFSMLCDIIIISKKYRRKH